MRPSSATKAWLGFWLTALGIGCMAPPRPPPSAPEPVAAPALLAPVPKCEKLEESCVARSETRARIRQVGWEFAPPEGWTYAQEDELTIAKGKAAALAMTARDKGDEKKDRAEREELLRRVAEKLGVTLPKKKNFIRKKPDQIEKVGDLAVDLYQIDGAKRDDQKGPLLVFTATLPEQKVLLGAGFVTDDDTDNSDRAIMNSIHSIARTASAAPADPKKSP